MSPNLLMLVGFASWLAGELWGAWRDWHDVKAGTHPDFPQTTSGWDWWVQKKFPIARVFVVAFLVSLIGHSQFGWWLLP